MLTVITGASGHVGINLIENLKARNRKVRAVTHKNNSVLAGLGIELVAADVLDPDSLMRAFKGADVVYHLAAHISILMNEWEQCCKLNIEGTQNVILACRKVGVKRLVHFSSIHALSQHPLDVVLDESRNFVKSTGCPPYDHSKAEAEKIVRQAIDNGMNAIIINPTGILGPNDYQPSLFGEALINMATGKYPVLVSGGFDWVDVRDVVEGAIRAEQQSQAGAAYLLSGHYVSVRDMAKMAAGILGKRATQLICPMGPARLCAPVVTVVARMTGQRPLFTTASLKALICNKHISHARATRDLGYNPRPMGVTLKDTLTWFKEHGYLRT
jgi:dihydroflavonol-4-reductase